MDELQKKLKAKLEVLEMLSESYRQRGEPELFGGACQLIRLTEGVEASKQFAEEELDKVGAFGSYELACCEALLGNHATAANHLKTALEADVLKFSASAQKCGDFDSMRSEVDALIKTVPTPSPEEAKQQRELKLMGLLGGLYADTGDLDAFTIECERIRATEGVEASKQFAEGELDKVQEFGSYQIACCESLLGNYASAATQLESALKADAREFCKRARENEEFAPMRVVVDALLDKYWVEEVPGTQDTFPLCTEPWLDEWAEQSEDGDEVLGFALMDRDPAVIVTQESFDSNDPYDIINTNIHFLNALREELFLPPELSEEAEKSYYVDFYLAQVNNGGFAQFVYNSRWNREVIRQVRDGLKVMGAVRNAELFERGAKRVEQLGQEFFEAFLGSELFGDNGPRDFLNPINDEFFELKEEEDLIELNSTWLRGLPNLVKVPAAEFGKTLKARVDSQPDRELRQKATEENKPAAFKRLDSLCEQIDAELQRINSIDPKQQHEGETALFWHLATTKGYHYAIETDEKVILINGESEQQVASLDKT